MKKKTKKVPNLPKYNWGGWQNIGQSVGQMGIGLAANQDLQGEEKQQANEMVMNNAVNQGMTSIPGYGKFHQAAMGLSNMGRSTIAKDDQGYATTRGGQIADNFMNPTHQQITGDLSKGQYGEAALSAVFNKGVASTLGGIAPKTKFGEFMTKFGRGEKVFAMGGMNMMPNAEVEGGENSMTLDGEFTQYDGPSHEDGGIPTSLEPQERVFSDRLKMPGTKKTFAKLNEENNTNKEDKILESTKYGSLSKKTAELMKSVKSKKSEMLFQEQEALKQAKVLNYAKKLGVDPTEFAFGGAYPAMTNPYKNFKGDVPAYGDGGENPLTDNDPLVEFINQRYKENILPGKVKRYNPKDKDLTFVDKLGRVPLEGSRFQTDSVVNIPGADPNLKAAYKNGKFVIVGTNPKAQQMAAEINKGKFVQGSDKTVYPDYSGYLPKKAYGGKMLPKYWPGGEGPEDIHSNIPSIQIANPYATQDMMNAPVYNPSKYGVGKYDPNDLELKGNPQIQEVLDSKQLVEKNNTDIRNNKKLNWSEIGSQAAMFAANNAGNIYNLSRYNKPEIEKYDRIMANLLNPKAAINDVNVEGRLAEKNIKDASGGNMGSYLSNRTGLASKIAQGKEKVRMNYDNANAGILTDAQKFNAQIAMQEIIANAQNRARVRSGKGEAIGSMGYNVANQFMDNKKGNMDQNTLQLFMQYYNDPNFRKYLEQSGFSKK